MLMGNERYDDRQHFEQIVLLDRPNLATTVNGDRQTDRKKERNDERKGTPTRCILFEEITGKKTIAAHRMDCVLGDEDDR